MRNIVPVVGAAVALALAPQLASAAPVAGGGALKAAAETLGNAENVTYYGYYRRYPRYSGYYNYYRPYYGYNYYRPSYGYYNYYRPYRGYRYY